MCESGGCCRWCSGFIFTLGLTALFMWLSLRPSAPTLSFEAFYIPALNHTALSNLSARIPPANVTIAFDFKLRNNNKDKGVFYDDLRLAFYHAPNRSSPIANLTVPAFYQGFKKTAHRKQGVEVVKDRAFWENVTRAVSEENRTVFRVDLETRVRYKIVGVKTVRHRLRLHADVEVNEQGKKSKRKGVKFHSTAPPPPPLGMKLLPAPLLLLLLVVW
ncbi:hypothetical protein ACLOJK_029350 [Asimina triloba]